MEDVHFLEDRYVTWLGAYKVYLPGKTDLSPLYRPIFTPGEEERSRTRRDKIRGGASSMGEGNGSQLPRGLYPSLLSSLLREDNLHSGYRLFGWNIFSHPFQWEDRQISLLLPSVRQSAFQSPFHWGYSPLGAQLYTEVLIESPPGAGLGFKFTVLHPVQSRTQDFYASWFHFSWGSGNPWLCMCMWLCNIGTTFKKLLYLVLELNL